MPTIRLKNLVGQPDKRRAQLLHVITQTETTDRKTDRKDRQKGREKDTTKPHSDSEADQVATKAIPQRFNDMTHNPSTLGRLFAFLIRRTEKGLDKLAVRVR
jgi:hypothetical protein